MLASTRPATPVSRLVVSAVSKVLAEVMRFWVAPIVDDSRQAVRAESQRRARSVMASESTGGRDGSASRPEQCQSTWFAPVVVRSRSQVGCRDAGAVSSEFVVILIV